MSKTTAKKNNIDDHYDASKHKNAVFDSKAMANFILGGAIGVLETDTIYGLVGSAFYPDVVNRIYQVKRRNIKTPFIILVSDIEQIKYFGVSFTPDLLKKIREHWPGPTSIVLPLDDPDKFYYLTRGRKDLCFRMPGAVSMFELLDLTGPLIATSANTEGGEPAKTVQDAYEYFTDRVDFYCDAGVVDRKQSRIIKFEDDNILEIRK